MFNELNWTYKGIKIDGVSGILLISAICWLIHLNQTPEFGMLIQLHQKLKHTEPKINMNKIKLMINIPPNSQDITLQFLTTEKCFKNLDF